MVSSRVTLFTFLHEARSTRVNERTTADASLDGTEIHTSVKSRRQLLYTVRGAIYSRSHEKASRGCREEIWRPSMFTHRPLLRPRSETSLEYTQMCVLAPFGNFRVEGLFDCIFLITIYRAKRGKVLRSVNSFEINA